MTVHPHPVPRRPAYVAVLARPSPLALAAALACAGLPAWAADPAGTTLDPVVVTAERTRQTSFEAPAAISAVGREAIEGGGLQVNLSESLGRVPGIAVLNRNNYAQDLQLSIRGFGSRSTFGIRGVRLLVDGIPATMPDGQGQASNVALGSTGRIEVLRGPLAQLYGNAAGGVVQVFSDLSGGIDGEGSAVTATVGAGSFGQARFGLRANHVGASDAFVIEASGFHTDGWRPNSAAERQQVNAKWQGDLSAATRVSVVFNQLDQPDSRDPLGLTRAQFDADPRQTPAIALQQQASKTVRQMQLGTVVEHQFSDATGLVARVYAGDRQLENKLSVPAAAQAPVTSAGGIVQFARTYSGLGLQLNHRVPLGEGRSLRIVGGVDWDRMLEDRQGYLNVSGVQGALKRDEQNTVRNLDTFAQGAWDLTRSLTATAGVRTSSVEFRTRDRFVVPGNPDDSGGVDYRATNPVIGLSWRPSTALTVYANAGRGFETPTFSELAYRPNATGLNTDLRASRSRHAEAGAKFRLTDHLRVDVALFDIRTEDDIIVDTNTGGRSTFKNAGRTTRRGAELSATARLPADLTATVAATVMRARFDDAFVSGSGAAAVRVPPGARLPGTPERYGFAELVWKPTGAWGGLSVGAELVATGSIVVSDTNVDAAGSSTVLNLRAGFEQRAGDWRFTQLVRVDNASDRRYAGSVIVNEGNQRFFEPALPRAVTMLATARYAWR